MSDKIISIIVCIFLTIAVIFFSYDFGAKMREAEITASLCIAEDPKFKLGYFNNAMELICITEATEVRVTRQ